MTGTIDSRVVELSFNNQQFEQGVGTSLKTLDALKKGLNLDEASKSLTNLENAGKDFTLDNIDSNLTRIADKFNMWGAIGFQIFGRLTNAAIDFGNTLARNLLGIDAMQEGFSSYETKINAVRTVMSATGETMDEVMQSINDLNAYSDRTVYSFQDMTENISKFTNAGLSSKEAALAIQGISNVAAESGANTNEAARAMYNFGQALSQGSVRLMDWKSIENANMATIEFKQQLIDAAVAAGTLKEGADGMYTTLKKTPISATKGFNDSLQDQWLTTEVLIGTLQDYASTQTEIGKKANKAATELKTYTQLMDNIQDSLKTSWTKSWEYVIGNLDEATQLFSYLGDTITGVLGASAQARNDLLKQWHDMGGRALVFDIIKNSIDGLLGVMKPIQEAFREIFPPITAKQLFNITLLIKKLSDNFKIGGVVAQKMKIIFKGFFAIFDIFRIIIVDVVKGFVSLAKAIAPGHLGILDLLVSVAEYILNLRQLLKENDVFMLGLQRIGVLLGQFRDLIVFLTPIVIGAFLQFKKVVVDFIQSIDFTPIVKAFDKVKEMWKGSFQKPKIDTDKLQAMADALGKIGGGIKTSAKALNPIQKFVNAMGPVLERVGKALLGVKTFLGTIAENVKKEFAKIDVSKIFSGINTSSVSGVFKKIDWGRVLSFLKGGLLAALGVSIIAFIKKLRDTVEGTQEILEGVTDVLDGVKGSLEAWQTAIRAKAIMQIAIALAILAASIIAISFVNPVKLTVALAAITAMFAQLVGTMTILQKVPGGSSGKLALTLIGIAIAMSVMAVAMLLLSKIDPAKIGGGLVVAEAILVPLITYSKALSKVSTGLIKGSVGLMALGVGLMVMAGALYLLGSIKTDKAIAGLLVMSGVLLEVVGFMHLMPKESDIIKAAVGIGLLAASLMLMSLAIRVMAAIPAEKTTNGLLSIAASLIVIIAAMELMPKDIITKAAGLFVVGAALIVIAGAIKLLGGMNWETLYKGLLGIAGAMAILVIGLTLMETTIAGAAAMIVAAVALTMLLVPIKILAGMDIKALGIALGAFAAVFIILGLAGLLLAPVVPVLIGLSVAMVLIGASMFMAGIGMLSFAVGLAAIGVSAPMAAVAIATLATSIAEALPTLAQGFVNAMVVLWNGVKDNTPLIESALDGLLKSMIKLIVDNTPGALDAIDKLLKGFIQIINDNVPLAVAAFVNVVTQMLQALADKAPDVVQAGYDMLKAVLQGIDDNIEDIADTVASIITKFLEKVAEHLPEVIQSGFDVLVAFLNGMADAIRENTGKSGALTKAIDNLTAAIIKGFTDGILSGTGSVLHAIGQLAGSAVSALKTLLGIASPSKVFHYLGSTLPAGLANGIIKYSYKVKNATKDLGKKAVSGMSAAISKVSDVLDDNLDASPVIRPVVDMTDVVAGSKEIDKALNGKSITVTPTASKASSIAGDWRSGFDPSGGTAGMVQSIKLTQINNSPKALSNIEIYRQTKNQLRTLRGLANS